jgi:hypothetical protein
MYQGNAMYLLLVQDLDREDKGEYHQRNKHL